MHSSRYGDLTKIAAKTDGNCHLCHEPADLNLYGPTGMFGNGTTTVDHLWPQAFGGGDEHENIMLAHGTCNSRRGIRDVAEIRLALVGKEHAPMSSGAKTAISLGGGAAFGIGAGYLFARTTPDGREEFNIEAAILTTVAAFALFRFAL